MTGLEIGKHKTPEELRFEIFLRTRGLKLTSERKIILKTIFNSSRHFDAENLLGDLKNSGGNISRATVYRTLDLLVQCGLVRKSSLGSSHANYEAARDNEHHDHLICIGCNKIIEFYSPELEKLQEDLSAAEGFRLLHHSLQIFGLCPKCKNSADELHLQGLVAQLHT